MAEEMDDIVADFLRENPHDAIVNQFLEQYEPVSFDGKSCNRCGAVVFENNWNIHSLWHRNMSFTIWIHGMFVKDHQKTHTNMAGYIEEFLGILKDGGEDGGEDVANLDMATTKEILNELQVRFRTTCPDAIAREAILDIMLNLSEEYLNYRTVDG